MSVVFLADSNNTQDIWTTNVQSMLSVRNLRQRHSSRDRRTSKSNCLPIDISMRSEPVVQLACVPTARFAQNVALKPILHEFRHPFRPVNVFVFWVVMPPG